MFIRKFLPVLLLFVPFVVFADVVDSLLQQVEATDNHIEKGNMYIQIGDLFEYTDPSQAMHYYEKAYNEASAPASQITHRALTPDADLLRAKSLRYIGIVLSDQGDFDKALENFLAAREILEGLRELYLATHREDIDNNLARLMNNIGIVYSRQGVFDIAREYYLIALEVYRQLNDTTSIAVAYNSLGIVEARQANLVEALGFFQQALDFYMLGNNQEGMAQTYNNLGGIHFQLSNWGDALELYTRSHDIFQQMGFSHRVAATKSNIGLVYQQKNEYSKAAEFLQASLALRVQIGDRTGIVESYNNLGALYEEQNNYETAIDYYRRANEMATELGDNRMIATSLISMGSGYFRAGNPRDAIANTRSGLEIAQAHNFMFIVQTALANLSEFYAHIGDYRNAYEYSRQHFKVSQSILDEQKTRQISELEIGYKAREQQQRIEFLEQETELSALKLQQSRTLSLILGLLIFILLVIGLFTLALLRQRNRIMLLKKENEAEKAIRKTDNDLRAILKTHAHGMLLLDSELNIVASNTKAIQWSEKFLGIALQEKKSLAGMENLFIRELSNGLIMDALKGYSRELEKEFSDNGRSSFFKFFCNPVFEKDDELVQSVSLMIEDITFTRNSEQKMLEDLKEKETLIKEIHHRVKNNMQVITSLTRLQSRHFDDEEKVLSFRELEQRIAAMSFVHEDLYKSENLSDIRFEDYLLRISSNLSGAYKSKARVYNHVEMQNPFINIDLAMPCGLVVNELLTNSLKHAFRGTSKSRSGEAKIDVYFTEKPSEYELRVVDNGKGLKDNADPVNASTMGFHLVKIIVEEQLRGRWATENNEGFVVIITFPKKG